MRPIYSRFLNKNTLSYKSITIASFGFLAFTLAGCTAGSGYSNQPWQPKSANTRPAAQSPSDLSSMPQGNAAPVSAMEGATNLNEPASITPVKVAILLPLSGQHKDLGQSLLNAAQMALFDVGASNFELVPKDTKGTADGARIAAQSAINDGSQLIIGPVFADSVRAAQQVTQNTNINMIAFSTDWTLANKKTFLIGFLPFDQVERVTSFATQKGYKRISVLSPSDTYGNGVVSAYQSISGHLRLPPARIARFSPQGQNLSQEVQKLGADYAAQNTSFDAVLMPVGGNLAHMASSLLSQNNMPPETVKRLGTGLLDDPGLANDRNLNGSWFAAPSPVSRQKFERKYFATYSAAPPRIASLAYDATALAAILARSGQQTNGAPAFDYDSLTNANGFSGIDGIFRFRPDGISERGLAVLEYRNGSIVVIDNAPRTFQRSGM